MNYLLVCTGNTCRSPMAEAILRSLLPPGDEVRSAGTAVWGSSPRSRHAVDALAEIGLACDGRAREVDEKLIAWADLVLCMEPHHREAILLHFDPPPDKIRVVSDWADPDGRLGIAGRAIEDPHGGTLDDYRRVRDELRSMMRKKLDGN